MQNIIVSIAIFVFVALHHLAAAPRDVPIRIESGLIAGVRSTDGEVRVFRGIPFAAPPVGALRWRPPQPTATWKDVRETAAFAPSCSQPPRTGAAAQLLTSQRLGDIDEDCLYLNIWIPSEPSASRLPVMVWFPGGGFATGGGSALVFDGEALAKRGVVVVTTNYRLGLFGFFAHPELTREANGQPTGNFGLMDQVAALKWVQRNIAKFGGDPNRVTIFGQSAGATSVLYQMVIPSANGLFHRAIGESSGGTGGVFALDPIPTYREAERAGLDVARSVGASSLSQLRDIPADQFLPAIQRGEGRPMIDGRLVLDAPDVLLAAGRQARVPLLTGSNADDGSGAPRNFTEAYRNSFPQTTPQDANVDAMAWRVHRWVDLHVKTAQSSGFVYYFTRRAPRDAPALGAYHGAEAPYVFHNLRLFDQQWAPVDLKLEEVVSSYWIRFATSGDPNGPGLPRWPAYHSSQLDQVMILGDQVTAGPSRLTEAKIQWFDTFRSTLQSK